MKSNKIFIDTHYPHPESNDAGNVYIILVDAKICTKLPRSEMFARGMFRGCMLEQRSYSTQAQANIEAMRLSLEIGARFVSPDEFTEIERQGESARVASALKLAEEMIARG